jgi:hypothetical protein
MQIHSASIFANNVTAKCKPGLSQIDVLVITVGIVLINISAGLFINFKR